MFNKWYGDGAVDHPDFSKIKEAKKKDIQSNIDDFEKRKIELEA